MKEKSFSVTKENGELETFSIEKFRNSLLKSHASPEEIGRVESELEKIIYPGIPTRKIYRMASKMLRKKSPSHSARFGLKQAIMELGPSGFPFERFIGALFEARGYQVEVGKVMAGKCVNHEVDVVASRNGELALVECKYHNQHGVNVDVKVPLYIHSRFQDLLDNHILGTEFQQFSGWIATNSRFTNDAQAFGKCKGLNLLGWNFPENEALKDLIDRHHLFPLTCLSFLTRQEKNYFLERGIVLVKELAQNPNLILNSMVAKNRIPGLLREIEELNKD